MRAFYTVVFLSRPGSCLKAKSHAEGEREKPTHEQDPQVSFADRMHLPATPSLLQFMSMCAVCQKQIAGDTEVKAKIKLQFIRPGGKPVVVSRGFSSTQKRGTVSVSAIDSTLQTYNDQDEV